MIAERVGRPWRHTDRGRKWMREWKRRYRLEHKEEIKRYNREYRLGHVEEIKEQERGYRLRCREKIKERVQRHTATVKWEVLTHYSVGVSPTCARCGETDIDCLVLDHVDGHGAERRRQRGGWEGYIYLRARGYPIGFQVLCMNCNILKAVQGLKCTVEERHRVGRASRRCTLVREQRRKTKVEVLTRYGDGELACVCCGEEHLDCLTIDHVNGNGAEHRRVIGVIGGTRFYYWLKREGYPEGYQTLCFNDQMKKERAT